MTLAVLQSWPHSVHGATTATAVGPRRRSRATSRHSNPPSPRPPQRPSSISTSPDAPQDKTDAATFVRQLAQLNLDTQLLAVDPDHPVFFRDPDPFSVPGSNPPVRSGIYDPDNISYIAIVNGSDQYRITGKRGNSDDLSVQAISGFPGAGSTGNPDRDVAEESDRRERQRHVHHHCRWDASAAHGQLVADRSPDHAHLGARSVQRLARCRRRPVAHTNRGANRVAPGQTDQPTVDHRHRRRHQRGHATSFLLDDALGLVALLVAGQPGADTLADAGRSGRAALLALPLRPRSRPGPRRERRQVRCGLPRVRGGGCLRPVAAVCHAPEQPERDPGATLQRRSLLVRRLGQDPGVPNWIDTEGYTQGFLFLRWQELTGTLPPVDDPTSQVVALSAVRSALPAGTPTVTPAQRKASLTARDKAEAHRLRHRAISQPESSPVTCTRSPPTSAGARCWRSTPARPSDPVCRRAALSGRTPAALPAWISIHSAPSSPAVQA